MTATNDGDDGFIGRAEERRDAMSAWPAAALHAALERDGDAPAEGEPLPPFWRWLYFLDAHPPSRLGRDGHPRRGVGLIPDLGPPRRMWAGGRLERRRPLILGRPARLISSVVGVNRKQGRSGPLAFVTLRHEAYDAEGLAEIEEQDLVYREDPSPGAAPTSDPSPAPKTAPQKADQTATWRRDWTADTTLLFRYSALTFNGHRIHYDLDYARDVEGYAGLVVHGPLLATLLLELAMARRGADQLSHFAFRARAPVTHFQRFATCGEPAERGAQLWIEREDGALAMTAEARFGSAVC